MGVGGVVWGPGVWGWRGVPAQPVLLVGVGCAWLESFQGALPRNQVFALLSKM